MINVATINGLAQESSIRDFWRLLKPGVMSLVVFSGLVGLFSAPEHLHILQALMAIICIALGSGAGAAFNMWYDRDIDQIMSRTSLRPIPQGKVSSEDALFFSGFLALTSVMILGLASNWYAAGLLAFAIFFYAGIYTTYLKRRFINNIVIGGAAGAFPPVIGWLATGSSLSFEPILLFLIIFFWTPPHFWALACLRKNDYAAVNIPMLPVVKGIKHTTLQMVIYSFLLILLTAAPYFLGYVSIYYFAPAMILSFAYFVMNLRIYNNFEHKNALKLFFFSIFYLFAIFGLYLADKMI
jgi:protoheme IX farnesyltransferase